MFGRKKIAMIVAEFLSTAVLAVTLYTIVARTSFPLFAALGVGVSYAVFVLAMAPFGEVHSNPALTLGLWTIRKVQTTRGVVAVAAQMLGGLAAWGLIRYFMGHGLTSLATGKFEWHVFVAEALGAGLFVFGVTAARLQQLEAGRFAIAAGASFFVGVLVASVASNAIINPAFAVGVQSWNWAYATAPLVGGIVGANLYLWVFDAALAVPKSRVTSTSRVKATRTTTRRRR